MAGHSPSHPGKNLDITYIFEGPPPFLCPTLPPLCLSSHGSCLNYFNNLLQHLSRLTSVPRVQSSFYPFSPLHTDPSFLCTFQHPKHVPTPDSCLVQFLYLECSSQGIYSANSLITSIGSSCIFSLVQCWLLLTQSLIPCSLLPPPTIPITFTFAFYYFFASVLHIAGLPLPCPF